MASELTEKMYQVYVNGHGLKKSPNVELELEREVPKCNEVHKERLSTLEKFQNCARGPGKTVTASPWVKIVSGNKDSIEKIIYFKSTLNYKRRKNIKWLPT